MQKFDFDVAILGGGSAGYAAARTAAAAGLTTAVIEGGREVGGLCILRGCMPTKALLYAAEVLHRVRHPQPWGIRSGNVSFDFKRVMARKDALIREFAEDRIRQFRAGPFRFIRAQAVFRDRHTLELKSPAGRRRGTITARHFIVATGSRVAPPPLPQLNQAGFLTSDQAVELKKLPRSLLILGGGAVACEFAQFFARFGVAVTLIQRSPRLLKEFDADAAEAIENVFRREAIQVFTGTKLLDAQRKGKRKCVWFEHQGKTKSVSAEEIFFALGRIPHTAGLGLERAGVKTEADGRIITDEFLQTSAPHIFAAGDCTGPHEIVHLAVQQGEIAARNIAKPGSARMDYRLLISIVFTDPQVAFVGLTEKAAAANHLPFVTASYPFNDHGKSLIMEARDGFVKLLADPQSGEILGGSCVGPAGGELIHEIVVAMAKRMTVGELAALPHYHPTLVEIWTYPAEELAGKIRAA